VKTPAHPRFHVALWGAAFLLVVVLPIGPASALPPRDPTAGSLPDGAGPAGSVPVPVTLSLASSGYPLSSQLFGTTISSQAHVMPTERPILNATAARVLVWPGADSGEHVDALNDTEVSVQQGKVVWGHPETNLTEFIALCRAISCEAILQVPAEIDNASFAAAVINYTEKTLGFHPAYWEVGNEPELWKHWDLPWTRWNTPSQKGSALITPNEYAWELRNYTMKMRIADPSIQILGLAGTGRPQHKIGLSTWINDTVALNPTLAGIAFHVYVAGTKGSPTLSAFYAADAAADEYSFVGRVAPARSEISNEINATCPGCPDPLIFVTEYGSALSHYRYGDLSRGFAGGLSMAATAMYGVDLDVANLDVFATELNTSNSWFSVRGDARPDYTVFTQFLSHLGGYAVPASFTTPPGPPYQGSNSTLSANLGAVATRASASGGRSDLLLLNQNLSTNVTFAPSLPGYVAGAPVELWEWTGIPYYSATNSSWWVEPETPQPVASYFPGGLPATFELPADTIAMFESYPSPGVPVELVSSGVPTGSRWFASVNGVTEETPEANLTTFLPAGTYGLAVPPLPLPTGKFYPNPRERLAGFAPASISVSSTPLSVPVVFHAQWELTLSAYPSNEGGFRSRYGWANASTSSVLNAVPAAGFLVVRWTGHGHGSYNGAGANATIRAQSPIVENVTFARGYDAVFAESGLPPGTPWSIDVEKLVYPTASSTDLVPEVNGTYDYEVGPVPGYRAAPTNLTFRIQGSTVSIELFFAPIVPLFHVRWEETGLPLGTAWSVDVDGAVYPAFGSAVTVPLANGTHLYAIGDEAGLAPSVRAGTLTVQGAALVVPLVFGPFAYPVTVSGTGLPFTLTWGIKLGGTTVTNTNGSVVLTEPNGTFSYRVLPPTGYTAVPLSGTVTVNGNGTVLELVFSVSGAASQAADLGYPPAGETIFVVLGAAVALTALAFVLPPPLPPGPNRSTKPAPPRPPRSSPDRARRPP
jgi:hypothetical protein